MSESSPTASIQRRSSHLGTDDFEEGSFTLLSASDVADDNDKMRRSSRLHLRHRSVSSFDEDNPVIKMNNGLFRKVCLCLMGLHYAYLVVLSVVNQGASASSQRQFQEPMGMQGSALAGTVDSSQRTMSVDHISQQLMARRTTTRVAKNKKYQKKIDNIPVFYNLFLDTKADHNETSRVRHLVNEQLSYLIPDIHYPVYVHSIGKKLPIPNTELLQHHVRGAETVTLHSLWQYCRKNKEKTVVYLHSKGSYHHNPENEMLRKFLTRSVLSRQCAYKNEHEESNEGSSTFSCNVCTSRFSPFPHPHTSGNMFLADCEYVSKLINPLEFGNRMQDIPRVQERLKMPQQTRIHPSAVGVNRFACEHWIHSAPSVQPCDLYKPSSFIFGYEGIPNASVVDTIDLEGEDSAFELQPAPRFQYRVYQTDLTVDYWTGLQYRLQEYQALYNETPAWPSLSSSSSWWGWRMDAWTDDAFTSPGAKNS